MAINFPASFAACIAAGLKVPRQIMYCISQDTGQPYVLYKDSQEAAERNAAALGGTAAQWGTDMYPAIQQNTQTHLAAQNAQNSSPQIAAAAATAAAVAAQQQQQQQQQQQPHSPSGEVDQSRDNNANVRQQQQQGSPSTSPYPQRANGGGGEEDVAMSQVRIEVAGMQQQQNAAQQQNPNQSTNDPQPISVDPASNNQAQQSNDQTFNPPQGAELGYYAPRHPGGPQGAMLAPPGFPPLHYLNKPVLPGMAGSMDQNGGLEAYAMPDLLPGGGASNSGNGTHGGMHQNVNATPTPNSQKIKPHSDLRLFKCTTCGKDFKQKSTLLQHERIHTDARPYPCTECGKRFRQQSHLTQHLRIHANEKPFSCAYCPRSFRQRAILNQHIRIHSGEKPYACPECGKHFRQKAILNQHVRTHQDVSPHLIFKNGPHPTLWPQDVPFPGDETDTKNDITGYQDDGSQGTPESRACFSPDGNGGMHYPSYFKDGKGQKLLPDVIQNGRAVGMPLYVRCPICDKEFKQKTTLLQHGCIHIESRPYPCPECGKRFRQQSHLTQHLRIHTNEKPFGCLYCPRFFRQRTILNQHIRIHTGEKPYKCSQCGKDFRQKAILDQHTRTHQVGDRPFCCPMPNCRRRFASEAEVKKHIDNHMNPHSSKARRQVNHNMSNDTKNVAATAAQFLTNMDSKANIIPRMGPVKHELYFPQCYGSPFNQSFGAQQQGQPGQPQQQQQPVQQQQKQPGQQQPNAVHNGNPAPPNGATGGGGGTVVTVANSIAPGVVQQNTTTVVAQ
ncbi:zinc finger protein 629 isoform X3 [Eupeodes corollae]|uniref:zinc finger protein 629 isoform X3 n=1 Tax=Eupeodes corollae TaxID=290404 RepID=UPI00249167AE|nr:zinc finger protein 629 isoform X3 [Eupeodes corollae]